MLESLEQKQEPGTSLQKRKEEDIAQFEHHTPLQAIELGGFERF